MVPAALPVTRNLGTPHHTAHHPASPSPANATARRACMPSSWSAESLPHRLVRASSFCGGPDARLWTAPPRRSTLDATRSGQGGRNECRWGVGWGWGRSWWQKAAMEARLEGHTSSARGLRRLLRPNARCSSVEPRPHSRRKGKCSARRDRSPASTGGRGDCISGGRPSCIVLPTTCSCPEGSPRTRSCCTGWAGG